METVQENQFEEIEKEFKQLGCEIIKKDELQDVEFFGVECDVDCQINIDFMKDYILKKRTLRNTFYYVSFSSNEKTLTMKIATPVPQAYKDYHTTIDVDAIATTFPDFCWIHAEGTTPQTLNEVETKLRDGALLSDLTWILPSKMADDFVEMMHTLNQSIIAGLMQDCIMYGLYFYNKKDF